MYNEDRAWTPVVAEREASNRAPTVAFPCRGPFNRYTGCVGARRCRSLGVAQCILGRWPDERQMGATLSRGLVEEATAPLTPEPIRPIRTPRPAAPPGVVKPAAPGRGPRSTVAIVHADRQISSALGRQVSGAGYAPIVFTTAEAATDALAGESRPAALLVDSKLLHDDAAGRRLLNTAASYEAPVLSLPASLRAHGSAEPAIRMATVWLTITLRANAS
jgi:hypothetical protein